MIEVVDGEADPLSVCDRRCDGCEHEFDVGEVAGNVARIAAELGRVVFAMERDSKQRHGETKDGVLKTEGSRW